MIQFPQQFISSARTGNNSVILMLPVTSQLNTQHNNNQQYNNQPFNIINNNLNSNNNLLNISRNAMTPGQNEIVNIQNLLNSLAQQQQLQKQSVNPIIPVHLTSITPTQSTIPTQPTPYITALQSILPPLHTVKNLETTPNQSVPSIKVLTKIRTKHGQKPYKCNVCFKSFEMKHQMMKHKEIHNGIKPHVCTICNTSYVSKYAQINHMRQSHPMVWETIKHRYLSK